MARRESDAAETVLEGLTPLRPSLRRKKEREWFEVGKVGGI